MRKVGHAGTLDPDATGVLLVGLGTVTRLMRFLTGLPKSYQCEVVLGVATNTLDAGGEVTGRWDMTSVTLAQARAAAVGFTGTIAQIPPMVSAVHVGGRRLHDLARAGIEVERQARTVTVARFVLEGPVAPGPVFAANVDCSTGTYVRSLAADLGSALGGGAHLRNLRRTSVGPYTVADAVPLDELSRAALRPPRDALPGLPAVVVDNDLAAAVGHGKVLDPTVLGVDGSGPWAILAAAGHLLAVYERCAADRVKPTVVLAGPDPAGDANRADSAPRPDPAGERDAAERSTVALGAAHPAGDAALGRSQSSPR
jgi:tRNA pseudouridine55 synthase